MLLLNDVNSISYYIENGEWKFCDLYRNPIDKEDMLDFIKAANYYLKNMDFKQLEIEKRRKVFINNEKQHIETINSFYKNKKYPGNVYFIRRDDGLIKVGCTKDIHKRYLELKREFGNIVLIHKIESKFCIITEAAFHCYFKSKRKDGEWFKLSDEDIEWAKKGKFPKYIQETINGNEFNAEIYFNEIVIGDLR